MLDLNRWCARFFLGLVLVFVLLTEGRAEPSASVDALIKAAADQNLSDDPYWWTLLHYKKKLTGVESLVDDPAFFLAPDGKQNPQAELEALIKTFFTPDAQASAPSVCRFIARYTWLREKLKVDDSTIPKLTCDRVDGIEAKSATVIFPTYYMNNPASMFGHTFINVETNYSSKLLSNAVNYSAYTEGTPGLFYTFNGVFGLFKGGFSILPYYKKIQEYSNLDQRDIWEYRLNLTEPELKRLVMHLYELENIYSYYYFFDENCSYCLLFLLDAARPSLKLTDRFPLTVTPIDTIKEMKKSRLVASAEFRPSNGTKIRHKLSRLTQDEQKTALALSTGNLDSQAMLDSDLPLEKRIRIVDLATEHLKYLLIKKKITRTEYQGVVLKTLKVRSRLGKATETDNRVPPPPDPTTMPDSRRIGLNAGRADGRNYQEISLRPTFTDLLMPGSGDKVGIQLVFLDARLRHEGSENQVKLEGVDIFDAISLSPRDRFFKPLSWKVNTGLVRKVMPDSRRKLVYRLKGGAGLSYHNHYTGLFFLMPELEFNAGTGLDHNNALGGGLQAGLLKEFTPSWKGLVTAEAIRYETGDQHTEKSVTVAQSFRTSINTDLRVEYLWNKERDQTWNQSKITLNIYF